MKHITKLTVGLITIALVSYSKSESQISTDVSTKISRSNPIITARQDNTPLHPVTLTLHPVTLNRLAYYITVEIVARSVVSGGDPFGSSGSGVIIGKKDSTYYVLSANHIFLYPNDYRVVVRSTKPGEDAEILKLEIIYRYPDADLAVFKFASVKQYKVAEIGEASQLRKNSQVYVGGWPGVENREGFQFTPAKVTNPRAGDLLTYEPTVPGEDVSPGMSGGAVLNEEGHLIGIHRGLTKVDGDGEGVLVSTFLQDITEEVEEVLVRATPDVFSASAREKRDVELQRELLAERQKREEAERRSQELEAEREKERQKAEQRAKQEQTVELQRQREQEKRRRQQGEGREREERNKQRQVENEISLASSARGVDYRKLRDLLAAGNWKEADKETGRVILKVARRQSEGYLRYSDAKNFSCQDLGTIDKLWVKYSNTNFGFSVQKQIYQSFGGTKEYDYKVWRKFGDKVGWRQGRRWLEYGELTFSHQHYRGHLPCGICGVNFVVSGGGVYCGKRVGMGVQVNSSLLRRLIDCDI